MYWSEEPWGSYRDNMHTALTIVEIMQIAASFAGDKNFQKPALTAFLFETKQERAARAERDRIAMQLRVQALARVNARKPKPKAPIPRSKRRHG